MNVLSLFDGISTGRLALEMAGIQVDTYLASEIEAAPMNIATSNWPGEITHLGDVRGVRTKNLPHIDLLIDWYPRKTAPASTGPTYRGRVSRKIKGSDCWM